MDVATFPRGTRAADEASCVNHERGLSPPLALCRRGCRGSARPGRRCRRIPPRALLQRLLGLRRSSLVLYGRGVHFLPAERISGAHAAALSGRAAARVDHVGATPRGTARGGDPVRAPAPRWSQSHRGGAWCCGRSPRCLLDRSRTAHHGGAVLHARADSQRLLRHRPPEISKGDRGERPAARRGRDDAGSRAVRDPCLVGLHPVDEPSASTVRHCSRLPRLAALRLRSGQRSRGLSVRARSVVRTFRRKHRLGALRPSRLDRRLQWCGRSPCDPIAVPAGRAAPPLVLLLPVERQLTGTPSFRLYVERPLERFAQERLRWRSSAPIRARMPNP